MALLGHVARYRGLATSLATASGDPLTGRCTATERAFERLVEQAREKEQVRAGVTATDITRLATAVASAAEAAGEPGSAERMLDVVFDGLRVPAPFGQA